MALGLASNTTGIGLVNAGLEPVPGNY